MEDFEKYKNKLPYPVRPKKPRPVNQTPQAYRECARALETYEAEMIQYQNALAEYQAETSRLTNLFWSDCFKSAGIPESHPKADKLKDMAWEYGHSSGFREVWNWFDQLAELI